MNAYGDIEERIYRSKDDPNALNDLISDYKPFVAKTVGEHVGHYVTYGEDDELTIGMLAFAEAVKGYDSEKGTFLPFAKRVINLRLIDYYRKQRNYLTKTEALVVDMDDQGIKDHTKQVAIDQYVDKEDNTLRKIEILSFKEELANWQISFQDLVRTSPKQEKLRKLYMKVARTIVEDEDLKALLFRKKYLPIKELQKKFLVNRKRLERGRQYIIACVIILEGDYHFMQEYIKWR